VRNDDPPIGKGPHDIGQDASDIFIGEPMKAVTPHSSISYLMWQGKCLSNGANSTNCSSWSMTAAFRSTGAENNVPP
jgi:hypothetical protein